MENMNKLNEVPENWEKTINATTQPIGYAWYNNRESRFSGKREIALVKQNEDKNEKCN